MVAFPPQHHGFLSWLSETPGNAGVDSSQGSQEASAASMKNLHLDAGLLGTASAAVYFESDLSQKELMVSTLWLQDSRCLISTDL